MMAAFPQKDDVEALRVFEFFAGIGGMRAALEYCLENHPRFSVGQCTSFECSAICNSAYSLNFEESNVRRVNIETLRTANIDGGADVWTLSPPCQPFTTTKGALQRGAGDNRSKGFAHVMRMLTDMHEPPRFIFFENVKGFCGSSVYAEWCSVLKLKGYQWNEFLLSPTALGIPNHRTRCYFACERQCGSGATGKRGDTHTSPVPLSSDCTAGASTEARPPRPLREFLLADEVLENDPIENLVALTVSDTLLAKPWAQGLSYVGTGDVETFCFTSAYGKTFHKSAGSLHHREIEFGKDIERPANMAELHGGGKVRLFAPLELLRLFGFPPRFRFPEEMKIRHRYKLIGQSVNVVAVAHCMKSIFWARKGCCPDGASVGGVTITTAA